LCFAAASSSAAVGAALRRGAAAVAESDGRYSPPPVDPSEVAGGELEVVNEEEDARMLELLRAQVRSMLLKLVMMCGAMPSSQSARTQCCYAKLYGGALCYQSCC
jgi:hypothetical protein